MKGIVLGCIADDFTGASDAASFLRSGGMKTVLQNGIVGTKEEKSDWEAEVIALKTRNVDPKQAVEETLQALEYLLEKGAEHIFLKYCSTFDSTPEGNIGPVVDAVLERMQVPYTILCPGLPVNGRTVRNGILYVDGVELDKSPMGSHPLTPMWSGSIQELMRRQGKYLCMMADYRLLEKSCGEIKAQINRFGADKAHFYIVTDFEKTEDARKLVEVFGDLPVLTGGSGLMEELATRWKQNADSSIDVFPPAKGRSLLLAGSCSQMTLRQIRAYERSGGASLFVEPSAYLSGKRTEEAIWRDILQKQGDVLVYSSQPPEERKIEDSEKREQTAQGMERLLSNLAKRAADAGWQKILVAGGETSGSVTRRLGYETFVVGDSVAPGVPILIPMQNKAMRLILKSGNFGDENFFREAIERVDEQT